MTVYFTLGQVTSIMKFASIFELKECMYVEIYIHLRTLYEVDRSVLVYTLRLQSLLKNSRKTNCTLDSWFFYCNSVKSK
jgi:hypothetical protein